MYSKNISQMKIEIAEHIKADAVLAGTYWEDGKGCFIGCLTYSDDPSKVTERFGLPEPSVRIAEHIFEKLSRIEKEKGINFFKDVGDAIGKDGKDLSKVHWVFLKDLLENLPEQEPEIQRVIDPVITGMDLLSKGEEWDYASLAAADAAHDAACTAADAAAYAAYVARLAAYAARFAAYAARTAGAADVEIERQAQSFLQILKQA